MSVEGFLVFIYDFLSTAIYFLDLGDHSIHECRSKSDQFEKIGDLLFQIPNLHVFVSAFDLIAGPVAVIVGFIFLWVMFGGVSLAADRAECKASQYEIKLLATAGIAIVFGHHQLGAFPCFFGDERFMFSGVHQSSPAHLAIIERIFKYLDHLAMREPLAGVSSKSFFI
ncbi:MAG: hypothetical protein Q7R69_01540 [bacterium]|nr:hypothetical protein [bacterium]